MLPDANGLRRRPAWRTLRLRATLRSPSPMPSPTPARRRAFATCLGGLRKPIDPDRRHLQGRSTRLRRLPRPVRHEERRLDPRGARAHGAPGSSVSRRRLETTTRRSPPQRERAHRQALRRQVHERAHQLGNQHPHVHQGAELRPVRQRRRSRRPFTGFSSTDATLNGWVTWGGSAVLCVASHDNDKRPVTRAGPSRPRTTPTAAAAATAATGRARRLLRRHGHWPADVCNGYGGGWPG